MLSIRAPLELWHHHQQQWFPQLIHGCGNHVYNMNAMWWALPGGQVRQHFPITSKEAWVFFIFHQKDYHDTILQQQNSQESVNITKSLSTGHLWHNFNCSTNCPLLFCQQASRVHAQLWQCFYDSSRCYSSLVNFPALHNTSLNHLGVISGRLATWLTQLCLILLNYKNSKFHLSSKIQGKLSTLSPLQMKLNASNIGKHSTNMIILKISTKEDK